MTTRQDVNQLCVDDALENAAGALIEGPLHLVLVDVHALLVVLVLQVTFLHLRPSFGLRAGCCLLSAEAASN